MLVFPFEVNSNLPNYSSIKIMKLEFHHVDKNHLWFSTVILDSPLLMVHYEKSHWQSSLHLINLTKFRFYFRLGNLESMFCTRHMSGDGFAYFFRKFIILLHQSHLLLLFQNWHYRMRQRKNVESEYQEWSSMLCFSNTTAKSPEVCYGC